MRSAVQRNKRQGVDEGLIYTCITLKTGAVNCTMRQTDPRMQTPTNEVVRRQIDEILSSPGFVRNERLSAFLRFVVEEELAGRGDLVKESVVGVEVFGRQPDYDVRQDSVVRTEAGKLRDRLAKYYAARRTSQTWIVELPKGGYRPSFRPTEKAVEISPPSGSPPKLRLRFAGALVAAVTVLSVVAWWQIRASSAPIPIAVIPLMNLSQEAGNEYFADGLTSEIIRNLSIIDGLAVRSQTSSFAFKGKNQNVHDVGKQLAAVYVLEGSILRSGQQLRIDAQLIRVRDDFPVWSGRYDRESTDVFSIQDEISRGIVNSLRLKLGHGRRRYETSVEAYDLYLHARALETEPLTDGIRQSIEPFEQVIGKDPSFAPAYAGLAAAHAALSGFDVADRPDDLSKMRKAAEKAIQLDPLLAEAHEALGAVQARDAQWAQSEKSFRRSLELDPNNSKSHDDFSMFLLLPLGRIQEAVTQAELAKQMDPLSRDAQANLAYVLRSAERFEESAALCPPQSGCLARALLGRGKIEDAIKILEPAFKGREQAPGAGPLGNAYARANRREEAEKLAAVVPRPLEQAIIFAGMGDKDRTLAALDRAIPLGPVRIGRALTFPELALLRGDPRVRTLRKKVGLPE
jgi:TolB-like protein